MALGRAAGSEVREDGRVRWAIGNSPIDYFNCVAYANLPGCPKDGLLLDTDGRGLLNGLEGDDEIRGLGPADVIWGGESNDVI